MREDKFDINRCKVVEEAEPSESKVLAEVIILERNMEHELCKALLAEKEFLGHGLCEISTMGT